MYNTTNVIKKISILVITISVLIPTVVFASHRSGPTNPGGTETGGRSGLSVCNKGDRLGGGSTSGSRVTGLVSTFSGGPYVPVKDFKAEKHLQNIEKLLKNIDKELTYIEKDTAQLEEDSRAIRYYLKALCEKEFIHDHTIQQDWAEAINGFVENSVTWIKEGLDGSPIFVTNPYVFYSNIEIGVAEAIIEEIKSDIVARKVDKRSAANAVRQIIVSLGDGSAGKTAEDWTSFAPDEKTTFNDADKFSWNAFQVGTQAPNTNPYKTAENYLAEFESRREQVRTVEGEKLAWGRGFFPYEVCGGPVFSWNPVDIRTCFTMTPGSTIQDMSTLVLSSALRQMELADEYEEWISGRAFWAMNSVFSYTGLDKNYPFKSTTVLSPDDSDNQLGRSISESDRLKKKYSDPKSVLKLETSKAEIFGVTPLDEAAIIKIIDKL